MRLWWLDLSVRTRYSWCSVLFGVVILILSILLMLDVREESIICSSPTCLQRWRRRWSQLCVRARFLNWVGVVSEST